MRHGNGYDHGEVSAELKCAIDTLVASISAALTPSSAVNRDSTGAAGEGMHFTSERSDNPYYENV